jgi:hypothetical protein
MNRNLETVEHDRKNYRTVTPEQPTLLRVAIANYRKAKKLMRVWEDETEAYRRRRLSTAG